MTAATNAGGSRDTAPAGDPGVVQLFVTAAAGTADLLADELAGFGAGALHTENAGVSCRGSLESAYRTCLWSGVGVRVLWPSNTATVNGGGSYFSGACGGSSELLLAACEYTFASELGEAVSVPVETWDERFTTRMAAQTRRQTGAGSAEDSIAAAHLLESYLQSIARQEETE